jgi:hypothetical protein
MVAGIRTIAAVFSKTHPRVIISLPSGTYPLGVPYRGDREQYLRARVSTSNRSQADAACSLSPACPTDNISAPLPNEPNVFHPANPLWDPIPDPSPTGPLGGGSPGAPEPPGPRLVLRLTAAGWG